MEALGLKKKKKFIELTADTAVIDGVPYALSTVNIPRAPIVIEGKLPSELTLPDRVEAPTQIKTLPPAAKQALVEYRNKARNRNLTAGAEKWGDSNVFNDGVSGSMRTMLEAIREKLYTKNIQLHLKKYTTGKKAPQWFANIVGDKTQRTAQGLPISISRFIKTNAANLDMNVTKALRAVQRLNSSIRMWKSFSKYEYVYNNYLANDPNKQKEFISNKLRRRAKNAIRKLTKLNNNQIPSQDQVNNYFAEQNRVGRIETGLGIARTKALDRARGQHIDLTLTAVGNNLVNQANRPVISKGRDRIAPAQIQNLQGVPGTYFQPGIVTRANQRIMQLVQEQAQINQNLQQAQQVALGLQPAAEMGTRLANLIRGGNQNDLNVYIQELTQQAAQNQQALQNQAALGIQQAVGAGGGGPADIVMGGGGANN